MRITYEDLRDEKYPVGTRFVSDITEKSSDPYTYVYLGKFDGMVMCTYEFGNNLHEALPPPDTGWSFRTYDDEFNPNTPSCWLRLVVTVSEEDLWE